MVKRVIKRASTLTSLVLVILIVCSLLVLTTVVVFSGVASSTQNDQVVMICHEHYVEDGVYVSKLADSKYGTNFISTSKEVYDKVGENNSLTMNVRISKFSNGSIEFRYTVPE